MTRTEHLLVTAMEECGELLQRISKGLRFGMEEVQPNETENPHRLTNEQRIVYEYNQLIAVLRMVGLHQIDVAIQVEKEHKVMHYLTYADQSLGARLHPVMIRCTNCGTDVQIGTEFPARFPCWKCGAPIENSDGRPTWR